ncbi:MAG: hypothetical protein ACM3UZ_08675 [Acidobacteriota bacterium]
MFGFRNRFRIYVLCFAFLTALTLFISGCGEPKLGTWTAPDGSKYKGYLLNDVPEGKGELVTPNGIKYVGEFKNGKYDGKGTLTQPGGSKYVGDFKNGMFNGKGVWTDEKGVRTTGEFRDNSIVKRTLVEPPPVKWKEKKGKAQVDF